MNITGQGAGPWSTFARTMGRLARRLAAIAAEVRYAQRRMNVVRLAPDRYLFDADKAPDTYAEFLFRTSGPTMREPSAQARSAGRRVAH
jgi:hypothetical protein